MSVDKNKPPVIAIIDDQLAVDDEDWGNKKTLVTQNIKAIAGALGYDPDTIIGHVRFFPRPRVRFSENEEIILALVDNNFVQAGHSVKVGDQIVDGLRYSFPSSDIIWISSDQLEGDGRAHMDAKKVKFSPDGGIKDELVNMYCRESPEKILELSKADLNTVAPKDRDIAFIVQHYAKAFQAIAAYHNQNIAEQTTGRSALDMARRSGQEAPKKVIDEAIRPQSGIEGVSGGL